MFEPWIRFMLTKLSQPETVFWLPLTGSSPRPSAVMSLASKPCSDKTFLRDKVRYPDTSYGWRWIRNPVYAAWLTMICSWEGVLGALCIGL